MASRGDRTHGLTVGQAADQLGISVEAVRQRLKRGTLGHTKHEGRVYVHLDADQPTDRPTDRTNDRDTLVESLQEQVEQLRLQLERADERDRENRRLLAAALERIPAIEAPQEASSEPREATTEATEQPGRVEPQAPLEGTQEPRKRPWWGWVLGPRDEQAYSRPLVRVLPFYVVGLLLTWAVAAYGPYQDLVMSAGKGVGWLGLLLGAIAALFFGVYAGARDGRRFAFARFGYVGLITAIGTAIVMFLTSLLVISLFWVPPPFPSTLGWTIEYRLLPIGTIVFLPTWLFFVSGALLGTALQDWIRRKEQVRREGGILGASEGGAASTSGVMKVQVWLGFAGTLLASLLSVIGTILAAMIAAGR